MKEQQKQHKQEEESFAGVAAFLAEDADLIEEDAIDKLDDATVSDLLATLEKAGY